MKIHCIRHESFEGLAFIEEWITGKKYSLSFTHVHENQLFPKKIDFELLIVMGGTASIYDESTHEWIAAEKQFISEVIEKKIKILGICLGAQIVASVLGARVYLAPFREIGWFPVKFNPELLNKMEFLPSSIITFHWHADTYDLPPGTMNLASSVCTANQGFIKGRQIIGLQFHPEMNKVSIQKLLSAVGDNLCTDRFVQTEYEIRNAENYYNQNQLLQDISTRSMNVYYQVQ